MGCGFQNLPAASTLVCSHSNRAVFHWPKDPWGIPVTEEALGTGRALARVFPTFSLVSGCLDGQHSVGGSPEARGVWGLHPRSQLRHGRAGAEAWGWNLGEEIRTSVALAMGGAGIREKARFPG